jgi:putative peptidoglycan lipid II flippase
LLLTIPLAAALAAPQWIGFGFVLAFVTYLCYVAWDLRIPLGQGDFKRPQGPIESEFRTLRETAAPLIYIMILGQVLAVVDRAAASYVGVGAIASLEYARVFVETPHVLIGTAIATTVLTRFSELDAATTLAKTARLTSALLTGALGAMLVMAAVAPELVSVVYERGQFDGAAVRNVTLAVRGLALSGAFISASYVMNRVLSAQLRNYETLAPMIACVGVAIIANIILVPRLGVFGVGVAMSGAYATLCLLLALRIGLLPHLIPRIGVWAAGAVAVFGTLWLFRYMHVAALVRLSLLSAMCTAAWLGVVSLFRSGRADLKLLVDQVTTLSFRRAQ